MAYWLLKSEPYKFSWDNQVEKGNGRWEKRVRLSVSPVTSDEWAEVCAVGGL